MRYLILYRIKGAGTSYNAAYHDNEADARRDYELALQDPTFDEVVMVKVLRAAPAGVAHA